jgi:hypothetical protein
MQRRTFLASVLTVAGGAVLAGRQSTPGAMTHSVIQSSRRGGRAASRAVPTLPVGAASAPALTLRVTTTRKAARGPASTIDRVVTRTSRVVHVAAQATEWRFERNSVDERRVSGVLVDHVARAIVFHDESDLRNMLGVAGWADVLLLGLDLSELEQLKPTGKSRSVGGERFHERAAPAGTVGLTRAWWSEQAVVPAAFKANDANGSTDVVVRSLSREVDASRLEQAVERFPSYAAVDLAEWLERR